MNEIIKELNSINFQIAELNQKKQELENQLVFMVQHPENGSKTYSIDEFKLTITSGYIYSIDKESYKNCAHMIPGEYNPVREKVSFDVDTKIIKKAEESPLMMNLLSQFITRKPKKIHVKVGANV